MPEGFILDPNAEPEPDIPDSVTEECLPEWKRLNAIMRGNGRIEQQLMQKGRQLQPQAIQFMRIESFMTHMLGEPMSSPKRLEFEIAFAEQVRTLLTELLLEA